MISGQTSVADLVTEKPSRATLFERYGIDYCCHGAKALDVSCQERNLNLAAIITELSADERADVLVDDRWTRMNMSQLADHIVITHHEYLTRTMPALSQMTEKIARKHGDHHPELLRVRDVFAELRAELESHMHKEEMILFPAVKQLESGAIPQQAARQLVAGPIVVMEHEHDVAGKALKELHALTKGYAVPEDACNGYRSTMESLKELEADLHLHIHKENNVLFKRVAEFGATA